MDYALIKEFLADLGLTTDKVFPLLILFLIGWWLVTRRTKPIEKKIAKIEGYILCLSSTMQTGGDLAKVQTYSASSPLKINDRGYQVLESTKFKDGIEKNKTALFNIIDKIGPRSAFDVEQFSIGLIRYLMANNEDHHFEDAENFLYQNPEYNKPETFTLAGLYLRDQYLGVHPELLPKSEDQNKQPDSKVA